MLAVGLYPFTSAMHSYSVNLMWINKTMNTHQHYIRPAQDEKDLFALFLRPIFTWASLTSPDTSINVWYDSETTCQTAVENTRSLIQQEAQQNPHWAHIELKDIRNLPTISQYSDILTNALPVFFRVDFLRVLAAIETLATKTDKYFVYADLDVEPLTGPDLFDYHTLDNLQKYGTVMARDGNLGFENGFFIINKEHPHIIQALKKFIIESYTLEARSKLIDGTSLNYPWPQTIYYGYPDMFKYLYWLSNQGQLFLRNNYTNEINRYTVEHNGFIRNTIRTLDFVTHNKSLMYHRYTHLQTLNSSCQLFIPTKKIRVPQSMQEQGPSVHDVIHPLPERDLENEKESFLGVLHVTLKGHNVGSIGCIQALYHDNEGTSEYLPPFCYLPEPNCYCNMPSLASSTSSELYTIAEGLKSPHNPTFMDAVCTLFKQRMPVDNLISPSIENLYKAVEDIDLPSKNLEPRLCDSRMEFVIIDLITHLAPPQEPRGIELSRPLYELIGKFAQLMGDNYQKLRYIKTIASLYMPDNYTALPLLKPLFDAALALVNAIIDDAQKVECARYILAANLLKTDWQSELAKPLCNWAFGVIRQFKPCLLPLIERYQQPLQCCTPQACSASQQLNDYDTCELFCSFLARYMQESSNMCTEQLMEKLKRVQQDCNKLYCAKTIATACRFDGKESASKCAPLYHWAHKTLPSLKESFLRDIKTDVTMIQAILARPTRAHGNPDYSAAQSTCYQLCDHVDMYDDAQKTLDILLHYKENFA